MSDIAIRVENLSKRYRIGMKEERNQTLVGALSSVIKNPIKNFRRVQSLTTFSNNQHEADPNIVWALKDVSFEIKPGEVVGIIGRNGAGKSTLLKVLSRITHPTSGRVELDGRVSSLLEVGTGFHPELTGRENIYLNGTILGMTRKEIDGKFAEIVDFSGVEKFIDTPVKFYSSGMRVRLAFSVAAHLEPAILLIDEVLTVGDAEFQKKCMGKMEEVGKEGRTVLFVSHQMAAVQGLCSRCILIEKGNIINDGKPTNVIEHYLKKVHSYENFNNLRRIINRSGSKEVILTKFYITDKNGKVLSNITCGQDIFFVFEYESKKSEMLKSLSFGFSLHNQNLQALFGVYNDSSNSLIKEAPPSGKLKFLYKRFPFTPGRYLVHGRILNNGIEADWPRDGVGVINVKGGDFYKTGNLGYRDTPSILYVDGDWYLNDRLVEKM